MPTPYTKTEIETAISKMDGFVDITVDDVAELVTLLEKNRQDRKKKHNWPLIPFANWHEILFSWVFSFIGIAALGLLHLFEPSLLIMIGSFGASAVLAYGAPRSPLAQPRNIIGGHVISALCGVCIHLALPQPIWLGSALAVSCAIAGMHLTKTLHPPGGATALIAIIGGERIYSLGFRYILSPVLLGAVIMVAIAYLTNNTVKNRHYPDYWF
ncbi:MAG: HPP family protein [Candidatus Margulisiibacteriota bacterium]